MTVLSNDFDSLFRELYAPAFAVAYRILRDPHDAEDAAAEALARTAASWRRIGSVDYGRAWVLRVTANVAVDMVRRRRVAPAEVEDAGATMSEADERIVLARALRRLPKRQREVLVLRFLADLTEAHVAELLNITSGAVKQHSRRGLKSLRVLLDNRTMEVSVAI